MKLTWNEHGTWVSDENGNRCSVRYWGSKEKAEEALRSLKSCSNCSNCSNCSRCSNCYDCSNCSNCSDCSGLTESGKSAPPPIPIIPDIHKNVLAAVAKTEHSLEMSTWHTCESTHCRGGWVVTLAGEAGKVAEEFYGTLLAAQLIYDASDPSQKFNPCRFFDSNEEAMADMTRQAAKP